MGLIPLEVLSDLLNPLQLPLLELSLNSNRETVETSCNLVDNKRTLGVSKSFCEVFVFIVVATNGHLDFV